MLRDSEAGVMCSATHDGLRVRRSKAETVERVGRKSAMGPGKPYWNRPEGSTGGMIALGGRTPTGAGGKGDVGVGRSRLGTVEVDGGEGVRPGREENRAAVIAAPDAAEQAAMIAMVVFDMMVSKDLRRGHGLLLRPL